MPRQHAGAWLVAAAMVTVACESPPPPPADLRPTQRPPAAATPAPAGIWSLAQSQPTPPLLKTLDLGATAVSVVARTLNYDALQSMLRDIDQTGAGQLDLPIGADLATFDMHAVRECTTPGVVAYQGVRSNQPAELVNVVDLGGSIRILHVGVRDVISLTFQPAGDFATNYITLTADSAGAPVARSLHNERGGPGCQLAPLAVPAAVAAVPLIDYATVRQYEVAVIPSWKFIEDFGRKENPQRAWKEVGRFISEASLILERDAGIRLCAVNTSELFPTSLAEQLTGTDFDDTTNKLAQALSGERYDVGHYLHSDGRQGRAEIGGACDAKLKARGFTAVPSGTFKYQSGLFLHEIAHQLGAFHTFSGKPPAALKEQWHATSAVEPGSGSTLMSYAGLLATEDIQDYRDLYFHPISSAQLRAKADQVTGCSNEVASSSAPTLITLGKTWEIPPATPFQLSAIGFSLLPLFPFTATSIRWDEIDVGSAPGDKPPLFRSHTDGGAEQVFPRGPAHLGATRAPGEHLPSGKEELRFRAVARTEGAAASVDVTVRVSPDGPFTVAHPSATDVWSGRTASVQWTVGSSAALGVKRVRLFISIDGGAWLSLAPQAVENDGGPVEVAVPALPNDAGARVRVVPERHVFFAESAPFKIPATARSTRNRP